MKTTTQCLWVRGFTDDLVWAGVELLFFTAASMGLWFRFLLKTESRLDMQGDSWPQMTTGTGHAIWCHAQHAKLQEGEPGKATVHFSTEAGRRGLAAEQFGFLSSAGWDTFSLAPGDLAQPLLSCTTSTQTCPQPNPARSCPKLSVSYLSTATAVLAHTALSWKVFHFNLLAEFTKAGRKAVSGLISILNIALITQRAAITPG